MEVTRHKGRSQGIHGRGECNHGPKKEEFRFPLEYNLEKGLIVWILSILFFLLTLH